MATEPTRKVGNMDCTVCGEVMPVRQNGRDTLNLSCPWCGHSSYAKGGTEAHRIVSGWIRPVAEAVQEKPAAKQAAPLPVHVPVPAAKQAVKPATIFG